MTSATMTKFGFPDTLVADYEHWCVLLRPAQATLGALVLVNKDDASAFSDIPAPAFAELAVATRGIERSLSAFRAFDRINYLMLMMVDPHVHFHVLPRYDAARQIAGMTLADPGWPGPPDLGHAPAEADAGLRVAAALRDLWPAPRG